jgi:hypothetical protein
MGGAPSREAPHFGQKRMFSFNGVSHCAQRSGVRQCLQKRAWSLFSSRQL